MKMWMNMQNLKVIIKRMTIQNQMGGLASILNIIFKLLPIYVTVKLVYSLLFIKFICITIKITIYEELSRYVGISVIDIQFGIH